MSGFITTMFVSTSSIYLPSFPAKPKPLQPIFTFVQSQSCMNLGMDALDQAELGLGICAFEKNARSGFEAPAPALPQTTYKSPVQRLGEVLRAPQAGNSSPSQQLNADSSQGTGVRESDLPPPTPYSSPSCSVLRPALQADTPITHTGSCLAAIALRPATICKETGMAALDEGSMGSEAWGLCLLPLRGHNCSLHNRMAISRALAYSLLSSLVTLALERRSSHRSRTAERTAGSSSNMRKQLWAVGA